MKMNSKKELLENDNLILGPLFNMLNTIAPLPKELEEALSKSFDLQHIPKGKLLLYEGDICRHLWFLAEGLLRSFHNIGDKEISSRIMFTGHIVISAGSFFTQTPATESIEALTDCTVARLSFDDLQQIYKNFPSFNYHTRIVTEQYFYRQEQRLYMLRKENALSRYKYFLENYSLYLKEIPQKYIASFLGMTPETLSRTRNKLRK